MDLEKAKELARQLLDDNGFREIEIELIKSKNILAQVNMIEKFLRLNPDFVNNHESFIVEQIILHEIAHLYTKKEMLQVLTSKLPDNEFNIKIKQYKAHGKIFKSYCKKLNCKAYKAALKVDSNDRVIL